jgi:hypothetical protein
MTSSGSEKDPHSLVWITEENYRLQYIKPKSTAVETRCAAHAKTSLPTKVSNNFAEKWRSSVDRVNLRTKSHRGKI